jgi:hypothetical protein
VMGRDVSCCCCCWWLSLCGRHMAACRCRCSLMYVCVFDSSKLLGPCASDSSSCGVLVPYSQAMFWVLVVGHLLTGWPCWDAIMPINWPRRMLI